MVSKQHYKKKRVVVMDKVLLLNPLLISLLLLQRLTYRYVMCSNCSQEAEIVDPNYKRHRRQRILIFNPCTHSLK